MNMEGGKEFDFERDRETESSEKERKRKIYREGVKKRKIKKERER